MVEVKLKGILKVTARGRTYYYAWRGGPRLRGEPGSPEFMASYTEALQGRRQTDDGRMKGLVAQYRASPDYLALADTTKRQWSRWLDRIVDKFGDLRVAQFDRAEKIRPHIKAWRNQWADKPRTADYAIQVLSRLLSFAVDQDKIAANPCEGIKSIYRGDRSELIWSDADLEAFRKVARPDVWWGVNLAAHTGLRSDDLRRLAWSHIGDQAIVIPTGKSRGRRSAVVPLYDSLRGALAEIPKRSTLVLTGKNTRPLTDGPNGSCFRKARTKAFPNGTELHFHDLRGTAATRFHALGLSNAEIAEICAWDEVSVDRIVRRYVGQSARTAAIIAKLNQTERRT